MSDTGRRRRSRRFAPLSGYDSIEGMNRQAVLYALASAALFGLSTPAAKLLVGSVHPVVLGGLLYCGAGGGVALLRRLLPAGVLGAPEVTLTRAQLPWLAGAIGFGGVLGPVLLMVGLSHTGAAARRCC